MSPGLLLLPLPCSNRPLRFVIHSTVIKNKTKIKTTKKEFLRAKSIKKILSNPTTAINNRSRIYLLRSIWKRSSSISSSKKALNDCINCFFDLRVESSRLYNYNLIKTKTSKQPRAVAVGNTLPTYLLILLFIHFFLEQISKWVEFS